MVIFRNQFFVCLPEGKILPSGNLLHSWTNRNADEKPIEMVVWPLEMVMQPLVMTNIAIEHGPVEIVDLPIDSMVIFRFVM